jgi:hypothetical protein
MRTRLGTLAVVAMLLGACAPATASPSMAGPMTREPMATPTQRPTAAPSTTPVSAAATPAGTAPASARPAEALLDTVLTDVRSGEAFTLADLAAAEGPVLLEPMAIWCSNCRAQQHEVVRARQASGEFASVSLDVDLSEAPEDLARYADAEGFDWRFAMADAALYRLLQERFGTAATNPPSTPLIVIERDGTVRPLPFGVGTRGAEQLLDELGIG